MKSMKTSGLEDGCIIELFDFSFKLTQLAKSFNESSHVVLVFMPGPLIKANICFSRRKYLRNLRFLGQGGGGL